MYKKTKLDNGLRIVACNMPRMQSVALGIWIKTGGRFEAAEKKGISHYLEHLLFKGSKKYSCRKLKESIEGVGGSLNGFTSEEATCYLVKLPFRCLDLGLDVLADMVAHPLLREEDAEKERTVILEEIKMYKDMPQGYVYDLLDELLWPGQMLGLSIAGSEESVKSIRREEIAAYRQTSYTAANIVVSAAGLIKESAFLKKVERKFSALPQGGENKFLPARAGQDAPRLKVLHKDTEQTHLALGLRSYQREHPLRYAQGLLHVILGGNMSSRLFEEVREKKGLAYEIGTALKRFMDTGAFIVHAGIDNRKVEEALAVILGELRRVKGEPVTADELKRAKEFYLGQLGLALEDTMDHMLWIGEPALLLNKVYTLREVIRAISRVKRSELSQVAAETFVDNNLNLALIGPLKDKEAALRSQLSLN
jgi:predicted Zn-dependent peptidase